MGIFWDNSTFLRSLVGNHRVLADFVSDWRYFDPSPKVTPQSHDRKSG